MAASPRSSPARSKSAHAARLAAPFGVIGIHTDDQWLVGVDLLPRANTPLKPATALAREVCAQLEAYFQDPRFRFDLPLDVTGTEHQKAVWLLMQRIASGDTLTYGEVAKRLKSSPRAVGQACGANQVPIVIPCHRVVSRAGLGGFMNAHSGDPLAIKRWLLEHERSRRLA